MRYHTEPKGKAKNNWWCFTLRNAGLVLHLTAGGTLRIHIFFFVSARSCTLIIKISHTTVSIKNIQIPCSLLRYGI